MSKTIRNLFRTNKQKHVKFNKDLNAIHEYDDYEEINFNDITSPQSTIDHTETIDEIKPISTSSPRDNYIRFCCCYF
jgi:hypothetical protein